MEGPIPRDKIETGITACLKRVGEYLLDAEKLSGHSSASQGTLQDAAILVTFAVEELGKAIILRKRSEEQAGSDVVKVEGQVFRGRSAHERKQSEAFKSIDANLKRLHRAAFSSASFGPAFDTKNVDISPDTRLQLSFVDFENGNWVLPPLIEPRRLTALITGAKDVMKGEDELQQERFKKIGDRVTTKDPKS